MAHMSFFWVFYRSLLCHSDEDDSGKNVNAVASALLNRLTVPPGKKPFQPHFETVKGQLKGGKYGA